MKKEKKTKHVKDKEKNNVKNEKMRIRFVFFITQVSQYFVIAISYI